jgi:hypothetical protein
MSIYLLAQADGSAPVRSRLERPSGAGPVRRDQQCGRRSGHDSGTPTLFIDGMFHHDDYAANTLLERLRS